MRTFEEAGAATFEISICQVCNCCEQTGPGFRCLRQFAEVRRGCGVCRSTLKYMQVDFILRLCLQASGEPCEGNIMHTWRLGSDMWRVLSPMQEPHQGTLGNDSQTWKRNRGMTEFPCSLGCKILKLRKQPRLGFGFCRSLYAKRFPDRNLFRLSQSLCEGTAPSTAFCLKFFG